MPMAPRPIAETRRPCPRVRTCIRVLLSLVLVLPESAMSVGPRRARPRAELGVAPKTSQQLHSSHDPPNRVRDPAGTSTGLRGNGSTSHLRRGPRTVKVHGQPDRGA